MHSERRDFLKLAAMSVVAPAALSATTIAQPAPQATHAAQAAPATKPAFETRDTPLFTNFDEIQWQKMAPNQPDSDGIRMAILHVDPQTKATELVIRVPAGRYVPLHWHSTNETHTVLRGEMTFECGDSRKTQGPGSFNYLPAKAVHRAWMGPDAESMVFITVDGAWDVNFVKDNDPRVAAWMKEMQPK
jgi:quercetin dioxygenase-like cupin family protein